MSKKGFILSIVAVLLIVIVISGATFAYFSGKTNEEEATSAAGKLNVIYTITDNIANATLSASSKREDGILSVVTARVGENSVDAAFNIYLTPTVLTNVTDSDLNALKWEVDIIHDVDISTVSGTFSGATINVPIKIIDGYNLLSTDTTFNIYVWLNGNDIENDNTGTNLATSRFSAVISADSVNISGEF